MFRPIANGRQTLGNRGAPKLGLCNYPLALASRISSPPTSSIIARSRSTTSAPPSPPRPENTQLNPNYNWHSARRHFEKQPRTAVMCNVDIKDPDENAENKARMERGDLFYAFTPDLIAEREKCAQACNAFNTASREASRLDRTNLLYDILGREHLPADIDDKTLAATPWVEMPFIAEWGYKIELGENTYINFNCTILDSGTVKIGNRSMIAPSCSFYSGTHPTDSKLRDGIRGPELAAPIVVGDDVWIGGGTTVLPGVTIGNGSTVGAGSVVSKDVPPYTVVAGNPARLIRRLPNPHTGDLGGKVEKDTEELARRMERLDQELKEVRDQLVRHEGWTKQGVMLEQ